jgi:hypothetical protein
MGVQHLERLRHIRGLLTAQQRHGAATADLLCFSGAGFTSELAREADRTGDVRLLTPGDLYAGVLLTCARAGLIIRVFQECSQEAILRKLCTS